MTTRKKVIICCLLAFLALTVTVVGLSNLLTAKVNAYVINLAEKMSNEVGHNVQIDRVTTRWDWLLLKINIKNLKITDKDSGLPLFMASEIISTVDTLDTIRSLSLKFKQLLLRNPRVVMQWNGIDAPSVLGFGQPGTSSKLLAMQRRIVVENGDLHLQGKDGADLPFMDVKIDFRHTGDREYNMVARGTIAAAVQPEFVIAIKYNGDLADYHNALVEFEIKTSNIELASLFNFLPQSRQDIVQGNFTDFDLHGVIQNGVLGDIASDFTINNIVIAKDMRINGGKGHIDYKPGDNKCNLQLEQLVLNNDQLYLHPIHIDAISTEVVYSQPQPQHIHIATQNASIKFMEMELHPEFALQIHDDHINALDFHSDMGEASVRRLLALVPDKKFPAALTDWMKRSLTDGDVDHIKINFLEQKLSWNLRFKGVELKFSPVWPSINGIDASMSMDDGKLNLTATKALILGQEISSLTTNFSEFEKNPYAIITIDGNMPTSIESALDYLEQTPLQDKLGVKLTNLNPRGDIDLALQLKMNVAKMDAGIAVNGSIQLKDTKADIADIDLPLSNLNGLLKFTNSTVAAENLRFSVLNQSASAVITTLPHKNSTVNIAVTMPLSMAELKKLMPNVKLEKVKGLTTLLANIELPLTGDATQKSIDISSDMVGITIDYPAPFNKAQTQKMPLNIKYSLAAKNEDTIKFKLGSLLDGILFLKDRKLHGGRVSISSKLDTYAESENLVINGNIKQLNWADWAPMLQANKQEEWIPIEIDLLIDTLVLYGEKYSPTHVKYASAKNELYLDSNVLTGTITVNSEEEKIDVKLAKLNIPEKTAKSNALIDYLRDKKNTNQLPMVQLYCDQLQVNHRIFKKVSLDLLPRTYGYEIMNFTINNDHILLQAQGSWQMDNKQVTMLSGNIYTQNFGKVLLEWGYQNSISRGNGEMNFSVQWEGGPVDFDVLKLEGASHLDLRAGSLTNVNPGLGRVISLLSLETIQRRLQLDFSDLLSKGFAFDKFVADFTIQPGSIMSDNILITSPAAKIELFGKTAIKSQGLDFTMFVTPKVGASLPIAAAIAAGNPAIGAAIWLFDKASGSKISEITKYKYKVSGTWDKPQIDEVSNNNDKAVG